MPSPPNSHQDPAPDSAESKVEEASFEQLEAVLERYQGVLRRAIGDTCPASYGIDRDDIEQDAILRLHKALVQRLLGRHQSDTAPALDERGGGLLSASYVRRVGVTAAIDAIRVARRRREDQLESDPGLIDRIESPQATPERQARSREISRRIRDGLAQLSEGRRRAVQLHLQGFSPAEIGRLLDWTEGKARNLAYRGLADLRHILARDEEPEVSRRTSLSEPEAERS